ncbi:MAG: DinB family protein [Chloroflexi bacterium]|nr:DinB family protein [Chloroflexota bacterium]MDA1003876.1 DinB family protein [Chloroflexota bacterium]
MVMPDEERARVRGYLLAQGEKYDFVDMWPRTVRGRLQLLDVLGDVSEAQARYRPAPDQWSIAEVALHILNSSTANRRMTEALAAGRDGGAERVDPPVEPTDRSIEELRRALLDDAVAWSALTSQLPEPPSFTALAPHPFFGDLHARAWYLFQRTHDIDHANQATHVKEAPGYPAG